jgi:hypothetical protein
LTTFDSRFGVAHISTIVTEIVIIVNQGLLTVALMVLILIGAVSSYLSVMRR